MKDVHVSVCVKWVREQILCQWLYLLDTRCEVTGDTQFESNQVRDIGRKEGVHWEEVVKQWVTVSLYQTHICVDKTMVTNNY
jgi:hypothetical protein